jgi:hypothetical protein
MSDKKRGKLFVGLTLVVLLVAGCGGDDSSVDQGVDQGSNEAPQTTQAQAETDAATAQGGEDTASAPSGPIEMNTIRVGSVTWTRTLDGSGQCFLPAEDGGDPVDGTVWGSAEPGSVNFSVTYGDASGNPTEADVEGDDFWWVAKGDDLVIEFDYDAMTISGSGTFENQLLAEDPRQGDFLFQCEPDS